MRGTERGGHSALLEVVDQACRNETVAPCVIDEIRSLDAEQSDRFQVQRPSIRKAPVQFDGQGAGSMVCDTRSHEYLSRRIRCSVIGTVPGRASGVTPRCEAPGTM